MPELPLDSGPAREASLGGGPGTVEVNGADFLQQFNGTVDGTSVLLDSAGEDTRFAWALYRFSDLLGKDVHTLSVQATPGGLDENYFVAVADYTAGSWVWFGPSGVPEFEIDLTDSDHRFITQLGNMYFVVMVEGDASATHHVSTLLFHDESGDELPGIPHDLSASDGEFEDRVALHWEPGAGALSYEVYRRVDGGSQEFDLIGVAENEEYSDATAEPGVRYVYKVRACNAAGCSQFSNRDSGYAGELNGGGEGCPAELSASDGTYEWKVRLEWMGDPARSYDVYRKGPDGEFAFLTMAQGTAFNDETAEPGVTYAYKIGLEREGGMCFSNIDTGWRTGEPSGENCPSELWASDGSYEQGVKLEWNGNTDVAYDVFRRLDGTDDWQWLAYVEGALHYMDETAEPGVVYIYKVKLGQNWGDCHSNTDSGFRAEQSSGEHCPTDLGASDGTFTDGVKLEWNGSTEVAYDVFRRLDGTDDWQWLAYVENATHFFDETAEADAVYIYKVGLGQNWGECFSNTDAGWVGREEPPAGCPEDLAATDGTHEGGVWIEWSAEPAQMFVVWRRADGTETWDDLGTANHEYFDETAEAGMVYLYKVSLVEGDCHSNLDSGFVGEPNDP